MGTSTDARAGRPSDRRFLVDDVDEAAAELCAAGVPTDDEMSMNARYRYTHFRAPQAVYELVDHVQPPG